MANGNKLIDQKAIDIIIDSILKAVEIKLNKKSSEGRGKDGKDGRDGKNAPQINDDEALSTNPWSGLKTKEEIAKVEGKIYPCTAQALEAMTQEQQAELYTQGYRAIKTENNGTVVLLGLGSDGSLEWLGCNQPRKNLLDNPNFAIAQAGYGGMHGTRQFAADRWSLWANGNITVTGSSGNLTLTLSGASGSIAQRMPKGTFQSGKTYTCAFYTNKGIVFRPAITESADYDAVDLVLSDGESITLYAATILEGSYTSKTLPPWEAPDAATEYLKCRRYWRNFDLPSKQLIGICFYPNAVAVLGGVFDIPMRSAPTCSASGVTSIDTSVRYDVISYIVGSDGLVWIAISNDTPISVGTYVYVWDVRLSSDL